MRRDKFKVFCTDNKIKGNSEQTDSGEWRRDVNM